MYFVFSGNAVATFKHHTAPITSVEWSTRDSSVFAASGSDEQLTLWDLAVERDDDGEDDTQGKLKDLPPQLLFIHMVFPCLHIITSIFAIVTAQCEGYFTCQNSARNFSDFFRLF